MKAEGPGESEPSPASSSALGIAYCGATGIAVESRWGLNKWEEVPMISVFGIMVGFYIITRMLEIISARKSQPNLGITGWMAAITILVTLGAMLYFLLGPDLMKGLVGLK
jgi:hypothetical protein